MKSLKGAVHVTVTISAVQKNLVVMPDFIYLTASFENSDNSNRKFYDKKFA